MAAVGSSMKNLGERMTTGLTLPIVAVGAASTKMAIDFQSSMELIHTQAQASQHEVDSLSKSVLAMAGSVATMPDELAKGLYHLESQGLRGAKALDALRISAEGAKIGGADLEDVTNALGAVISGKLVTGVAGYQRAMGEMNAIVGSGDMRMQDLADAMGTALPSSAKLAGVSLTDVGAALAVLGDNLIRGRVAGTNLQSALRLMEGPSDRAAKAMASYGISAQALGNTLSSQGLLPALQMLHDKLADLSTPERFRAITEMFGGKQAKAVMVLIDQIGRFKQKLEDVSKAGLKFASDWESYTKTTAYHLDSMGAAMAASGISIGDILLPVVSKLADVIGGLVNKFDALSPHTKKLIEIGAGVVAALGPVVFVVGNVANAISGLSKAFTFLAANPIVLLIAGIAAFAAAVAAAVLWPDKLRDVLEKMGLSAHAAGEIVAGLQDVFQVVKDAGEALVGVIRSNWSTTSNRVQRYW